MDKLKLYHLFVCLGWFAIVYYCILKIVNFHAAFAGFWLALAILSYIAYWALKNNLIGNSLGKILTILISIGLIIFFVLEGLIIYTGTIEDDRITDYVLVLGAGINKEQISKSLRFRLNKAIEFNKVHGNIPIIVSGGMGKGEDITEALAMKRYLVSNGVDENNIIMEGKSTNTYENFKFSKAIMENKSKEKDNISVTLITNRFHMFRAKYIGVNTGLKIYCYSAKNEIITSLNFYVRESFAYVKELIYHYIK
ncbi:YdcF family protein [uncultured Clostridium sp.]|uniref:YdcF family protein n=1 Tax=uncultured Clostridium sp. TaxID=59620 RepID=UPI003217F7CB